MYKYKPARDKLSTRTFLVTRKENRERTREWPAPSLSFVCSLVCCLRATFHKWRACSQSTAISREVVSKSLRNIPEKYCGWFWVHCSSNKFKRMPQQAMDVCLRVLKESNKSRFDSYSRQEQCIENIPYYLSGLSRAHFFWQPFSKYLYTVMRRYIARC